MMLPDLLRAVDPCRLLHPLTHHAWPVALRHIRHAIRRHAIHAIAIGGTIVCGGAPLVVLMLPPATEPSIQAPVPVGEPAGVAVFGVGVAALVVIIRWTKRGKTKSSS